MANDLSDFICLDVESGTFTGAENCCLINVTELSAEELELLNEGTDTERALLADKYGLPLRAYD